MSVCRRKKHLVARHIRKSEGANKRRLVLAVPASSLLNLLLHLSRRTTSARAACPSSLAEPADQPRCKCCSQADSEREEKRLMDGVCQHNHRIETLISTLSRGHGLHLIPPGFRRFRRKDHLLQRRHDAGHIFRAKQVDANKSDGEIENGEDRVHPQRVPPVRLDKVLQAL